MSWSAERAASATPDGTAVGVGVGEAALPGR